MTKIEKLIVYSLLAFVWVILAGSVAIVAAMILDLVAGR